jgi:uncharacterized protein YjbI with pentapeptide repeats
VTWWIAGVAAALLVAAVAGMRIRRVRSRVTDGYRGFRRSLRGLSLLPAVCLAVVGAVGIVLLATWILRVVIHTTAKEADPIDITKLSFTVAGGVGAAVALVVAYRRQRDVEQGRFVERFGAAAAQLGDHDVAVRIAGVYAMAGVADESTGLRRQQCIDVLCGYLRLPYSPEQGANHRTKLILAEPRTADDGSPLGTQEEHLEYRQNDKEVRATIVRVIADHLRRHEYSWSACDFDFRTAHLENVDFGHTVFDGTTRFDEATFSGDAGFGGAAFYGTTRFDEATFSGGARFDGAIFFAYHAYATFCGATFSGDARFGGAMFGYHSGTVSFDGATFCATAWFDRATFSRYARFVGATFSGRAWFDRATFSRYAQFDEATFSGDARFDEATFSGSVSFARTDFGTGAIAFDRPRQWGPPAPTFDWDGDPSTKPENVTPQSWPPTPVA